MLKLQASNLEFRGGKDSSFKGNDGRVAGATLIFEDPDGEQVHIWCKGEVEDLTQMYEKGTLYDLELTRTKSGGLKLILDEEE